jgi:uncharacterized protein
VKQLLAVFLLAVAACGGNQAGAAPAVAETAAGAVPLTGRVVDRADVLTPEQELDLTSKLEALEKTTTDQVVVVTLPSLGEASIEETGLALARGWKLGRAEIDNGVLVIVAPNEKKVRVEVGYALEGLLTNQRAAQTIAVMLPKFRQGDLPAAIQAGTDDIVTFLQSDRKRPRYLSEERRKLAA